MKPRSQLLIHSDAFKPLSPFTTESLEDDTSWLPPHVLVRRAERSTHVSEPTYLSGWQPDVPEHDPGSDRAGCFTARRSFSSPDTVNHVTNPSCDSQPQLVFFFCLAHCFHFYYLMVIFSPFLVFFLHYSARMPSMIHRWHTYIHTHTSESNKMTCLTGNFTSWRAAEITDWLMDGWMDREDAMYSRKQWTQALLTWGTWIQRKESSSLQWYREHNVTRNGRFRPKKTSKRTTYPLANLTIQPLTYLACERG